MTFGEAIEHLKDGHKVTLPTWNGKGMYIFLVTNWTIGSSPAFNIPVITELPFICMKTADNKLIPWLASQWDLLSEDWELVIE